MSTPSTLPMPDFNQMANSFDRYLPQIHPVALALLDHLPAPDPGATVLDVACGTGEPGLTLARRSPEVRVLGVDSASAMIEVAQGKAARRSPTRAWMPCSRASAS
jgi:ubiquinone/menaquinone biosynthesis C-methylase UbiE